MHRTLYPLLESEKRKEVPTFQKFVDEHWLPVYPEAVGNRPTTI